MTGLTRPSFARNGIIDKTALGQVAFVFHQSRDVYSLLAKNVDFAVIKTHLSLGFRWNA